MALVCAISGAVPEDPVISPEGYIFERRVIEKKLEVQPKCPVTGKDLSKEELRVVQRSAVAKPRLNETSSIPGLLTMLQNEWDTLMVEAFELRAHLDTVRNQLSHSLYQHDAACRVIARLLKERDSARQQVSQLQGQISSIKGRADIASAEIGISTEVVKDMEALFNTLLTERKQRFSDKQRTFEAVSNRAKVASFACATEVSPHQTTAPGVLCSSIDPKSWSAGGPSLIATGGVDAAVVIFDVTSNRTVSRLLGHLKKVNKVAFHSKRELLVSGSDDQTLRIWAASEPEPHQYRNVHTIRKHLGPIYDVMWHPLEDYFGSCSSDRTWAFHDANIGRTLVSVSDLDSPYHALQFHPDGIIVAGGAENGMLGFWDVRTQGFLAALPGDPKATRHTKTVSSLSFSENGFHLASSSLDGTVNLWDLRKREVFQTVDFAGVPVNGLSFDNSGQYLCVALENGRVPIYVFDAKAHVSEVVTLAAQGTAAAATSVCFGRDAEFLVHTSRDRNVRVWRPTA